MKKTISTYLFSWQGLLRHCILLILVSLFAFSRNPALLLMANDGPTGFSLADEELNFFGITPHLHGNLLEGLNNISLPYNLSLQPGYWLSMISHGKFAIAFLYS